MEKHPSFSSPLHLAHFFAKQLTDDIEDVDENKGNSNDSTRSTMTLLMNEVKEEHDQSRSCGWSTLVLSASLSRNKRKTSTGDSSSRKSKSVTGTDNKQRQQRRRRNNRTSADERSQKQTADTHDSLVTSSQSSSTSSARTAVTANVARSVCEQMERQLHVMDDAPLTSTQRVVEDDRRPPSFITRTETFDYPSSAESLRRTADGDSAKRKRSTSSGSGTPTKAPRTTAVVVERDDGSVVHSE
jgi:hypothetical protein